MFEEKIPKSFYEKHILFTSFNDIQSICQPFFAKTGTTYFNYIKRYNNGYKVSLSNRPDWHRYYYHNELFKNVLEIETRTIIEKSRIGELKVVLWNNTTNTRDVTTHSASFDIGNGISLAIVHEKCVEYCYFGAENKNEEMSNWYINNIDILIEFIHYFKDAAGNIIAEASLPKNLITYHNNIKPFDEQKRLFTFDQNYKDYNKPKRYFVYTDNNEVPITAREMECIKYMFLGYTSNQIGTFLVISERTVEKHLENVKFKLACSSKSDLIDIILKSGLSNLIKDHANLQP